MKHKTVISLSQVQHISSLAHIPVTEEEAGVLAQGFSEVLEVVEKLGKVKTEEEIPVPHMTGLSNVFREDLVDESRMFTQAQALQNASNTHDGYFVVDQIIDSE